MHDRSATRRHFKDLLFRACPGDGVFFFSLSASQQPTGAATEFRRLSSKSFCHKSFSEQFDGILSLQLKQMFEFDRICYSSSTRDPLNDSLKLRHFNVGYEF
jgi:hypothetical protein